MTNDGTSASKQAKRDQMDALRARLDASHEDDVRAWVEIHRAIPDRLFHYTTIEGAMGIVGSGSMWASDVRYMNDSSELRYAESVIANFVNATVAEEASGATAAALEPYLARGLLRTPMFPFGNPFIACLCEDGDLLSQWRGYGTGDAPVALGLDLTMANLPPTTALRKVIYNEGTQRELVASVARQWVRSIADVHAEGAVGMGDLLPYPALWVLRDQLYELMLCFKHPSFAEEQEWRLITMVDANAEISAKDMGRYAVEVPTPIGAKGYEVGFRSSALGLVPYISLDLRQESGFWTGRIPLRKVVQGPTSNAALRLDALHMYFRSNGYTNPGIEFAMSGIPLRR